MFLRLGLIAGLIALYSAGMQLAAHQAPTWVIAAIMGAVFVGLVAAMYLRVLPALLALPILAIALASIAGMRWQDIFSTVVQDGSVRLSKWIIAAILGAILAQIVEKTGIAQTAIKKTAELGGDQPMILAVLLTIVIALLFTTLGGLGAVIMVATIVFPILLSLGLRPLYVGCLFLLGMSLGGAFNVVNWQGYQDTLGMTQSQIIAFALPFAGLMLITTFVFLFVERDRLGKARYKAAVEDGDAAHVFVPWYALLTPVVPLLPMLFFSLLPRVYHQPPECSLAVTGDLPHSSVSLRSVDGNFSLLLESGQHLTLVPGKYQVVPVVDVLPSLARTMQLPPPQTIDAQPWTTTDLQMSTTKKETVAITITPTTTPTNYEFPVAVALLLGIIYGAVTTWRRGQSTVQLVTKAAFDGVASVAPAVVLIIGIGMVLNATMSPQVAGVISPLLGHVVPGVPESGLGIMIHYVALFALLAPLALYRGPLNMYGMGAGIIGAIKPLMPGGAIMGLFISVGMIQGVCDPTNTHNVWVANYLNTDVQDILKRTLPYMWILAIFGLILSAILYYGGVLH